MFYHVKILYSAKIITELVFIKNKKINTSIFYNYQLCFLTNPHLHSKILNLLIALSRSRLKRSKTTKLRF